MAQPTIKIEHRRGRPPLPEELKKAPKEPKSRGRPRKFNSEEEKKQAKKEYETQYYKEHAERICEHKRRLYIEKNELIQQLLEENKQLMK